MPLLPGRRALSALAAVVVALTLAGGAQSAAGAPPSPQDVETQRSEADRLAGEARADEQSGDQAQTRLDELAIAAGAALEEYQLAQQARFEAEADNWNQAERLDAAQQSLRSSRGELGRWAAQAYRDGPAAGAWGLDALLDSRSSDELGQQLALLEVVTRSQGSAVEKLQEAAGAQAAVSAEADLTAQGVLQATERASLAKDESERLVAEQRAQLDVVEAQAATSREAADAAGAEAERLEAARELADRMEAEAAEAARREAARSAAAAAATTSRSTATSRSRSGQVTGATGTCRGQDVSWFANGQIPLDALCPLWGAPGQQLRADAAYAFEQMSTAYARQYGKPLCVTDSYRPYADQVRLYASKPGLAARPGTSNHGWGVALDMCGGVQSFGGQAHRWMRANAPLYGWFHPGWAQQGGSKPEPWHWEFSG